MKKMSEINLKRKITQVLLQNKQGMVKESDLINISGSEDDFKRNIKSIIKDLQSLGFSLSRTTFGDAKYYVLTTPGKAENISPSMYGALGLIIATFNEIGDKIPLLELKKTFKNVWQSVEQLIENNYLQVKIENGQDYLKITPVGKASFKNVLKSLTLKDIIADVEKTTPKKN